MMARQSFPIWFAAMALLLVPTAGQADTPSWAYSSGPLAGSLKTAGPLPIYHPDPQHLWNRLFAAFYIRPSRLPSRPEYPADTTQLDPLERLMRAGKLPPGPVVPRIEGGDVLGMLAWPKTRYFSTVDQAEREGRLLDEFLSAHGERQMVDPLKRAMLQRDLWVAFDHLVNQNIDHFGDADLARRRADVNDYGISPAELRRDDRAAIERRQVLCRKLAHVIRRLALPPDQIKQLPDNYSLAVKSGAFRDTHDFDPSVDYLPVDLLRRDGPWLEIDNVPTGLHHDPREGELQHTAFSGRGHTYYRVFLRFPTGKPALVEYLDYLQREGVDWERSARTGYVRLKSDVRQIPPGTETAIVGFVILLDQNLMPVPTRLVELVHLRIFKNVTGKEDGTTNTGLGVNCMRYSLQRRLLFDGLRQGGLHRVPDRLPTYRVLMDAPRDWGQYGRQRSVVQTCLSCHMFERDRVGVHSLNSISCFVAERGMPGIIQPMGSGPIQVRSRGDRTVRWKRGQEDYLRLVLYARGEQ